MSCGLTTETLPIMLCSGSCQYSECWSLSWCDWTALWSWCIHLPCSAATLSEQNSAEQHQHVVLCKSMTLWRNPKITAHHVSGFRGQSFIPVFRQSLEIVGCPFTENRCEECLVIHVSESSRENESEHRSIFLRCLDCSNISCWHKFGTTFDDFFGCVAFVFLDHIWRARLVKLALRRQSSYSALLAYRAVCRFLKTTTAVTTQSDNVTMVTN